MQGEAVSKRARMAACCWHWVQLSQGPERKCSSCQLVCSLVCCSVLCIASSSSP